jgi:hypothetical protein
VGAPHAQGQRHGKDRENEHDEANRPMMHDDLPQIGDDASE